MPAFNFGIIGCGQIAQRHAAHIKERGRLVAVCDTIPAKAQALATAYGCRAFFSVEEMCAAGGMDVVAVCTPNGLHAQHSIAALNAGFHVICEKPMAIASADARQMIAAAEKSGKHLFIVKQNRFNPPVAWVKQLLVNNKLGKIYSIHVNCFWNRPPAYYSNTWRGTLPLDGGTLYTQFSHFIDLLYWLAGDVKKVDALLKNFQHQGVIEFEDTGIVHFEFENGAIGSIQYSVNSYRQNMEGSFTIIAEKGTVKVGGQYMNTLEYHCLESNETVQLPPGNAANNYGHYQGSMSNHGKVYDNVIDVLEHGAPIATGMADGLKTVEIIEKIYQQARRQ